MNYLPIFVNITLRPSLVVGGGEVAARKASLLAAAGAELTVVAPELQPTLAEMATQGRLRHWARTYQTGDVEGFDLVIAATDDAAVNAQVSAEARARHIPVNVVDNPKLCSFIVPAIIDRSPLVIAVSSGGAAPVFARLVRARLESTIPAAYGKLAQLSEFFRARVKSRFPNTNDRRGFWERLFQGRVAELVFTGRETEAYAATEAALAEAQPSPLGEVYLVGAGPGDPDLLTFRALRLMQQADVIVYDRLVSSAILELARRDAERIYVGKERNFHTLRQEEINRLLADLAKQGRRVCRLKGGDPFIFGRGGEEIDTLAAEGIPFQVVPGITAATGCAAYAGIPLTHRDYAQACVFVTGHLKDGSMNLNWAALCQPHQTIAIYMGLTGLEVLCRELVEHGLPSDLPAALIEQGTLPQQRVFSGTLATLPEVVAGQTIRAPTLIIIGEVVRLREKLGWYGAEHAAASPILRDR